MRLIKIIRQSLKAVFSNKGRSFLTMLGIVIGVAAVIALMSLGNGAKQSITDRVSILGSTNITVMPGAAASGNPMMSNGNRGEAPAVQMTSGNLVSTLSQTDLDSLEELKGKNGIVRVTGNISGTEVLNTRDGDRRFDILGTSPGYFQIMNLEIAKGAGFTEDAVSSAAKQVVIGKDAAREIFGSENPLGKTIDIKGAAYTIVGVLGPAKENGITNSNIQLFIPYTAARESLNTQNFSSIMVQTSNEDTVKAAKKKVENTLLANHGIEKLKLADFTVRSSQDLLSTITSITDIMTGFLGGIAAISLLVGGIGIMNIMLVSVTERTREIGLRKSVGAGTGHILTQFLVEALLLTFTGGILGIIFGRILGSIAAGILDFPLVITSGSVLLAVCVSVLVGIIFGIYPAAKAARLDPIDALRYE